MKAVNIVILGMMVAALNAQAQTASVKDIPAEGDTTISISKGKNSTNEYQVTEGTAEIEGDPEILKKEARANWKKACEDWKKEIRELNKDSQVVAISCNSATCTKNDSTEIVCKSAGTYKIRVKVK